MKPFGGAGDPLVGDFNGALLVKTFRALAPELTKAEQKKAVSKLLKEHPDWEEDGALESINSRIRLAPVGSVETVLYSQNGLGGERSWVRIRLSKHSLYISPDSNPIRMWKSEWIGYPDDEAIINEVRKINDNEVKDWNKLNKWFEIIRVNPQSQEADEARSQLDVYIDKCLRRAFEIYGERYHQRELAEYLIRHYLENTDSPNYLPESRRPRPDKGRSQLFKDWIPR